MKIILTVLAVSLVATTTLADINDARITEVWVGLGGGRPDGTHDWIEVTNLGDTPIDTSEMAYDDDQPNLSDSAQLPSIILQPGQSAVFVREMIADNPIFDNSLEEFLGVWIPFNLTFLAALDDAARLSTDGDSANLLNATTGELIDTLAFNASQADTFSTIERIGEAPTNIRQSVVGERCAFESQTYQDEDTLMTAVDKNGIPIMLIGSPGIFQSLGDINCDGAVNLLDVAPFVEAIGNGDFVFAADINQDGAVNLLDVSLFIDLLAE